jgi:signal transduction histidine kinase
VVAFPSGRLRGRGAWFFFLADTIDVGVFKGVVRLFNDPRAQGCAGCRPHLNLLHIPGTDALYMPLLHAGDYVIAALVVAWLPWLAMRWSRATPPARRVMAVAYLAAVAESLGTLAAVVAGVVAGLPPSPVTPSATQLFAAAFYLDGPATTLLPLGLLYGLLKTRMTRSIVGNLVVELSSIPPPRELQAALARALGDPSLQLGLCVGQRYVDVGGHPMDLPENDAARTVTPVDFGGRPLAVLVHDPAVLDDRGLVDAVAAAARMALQNARLQAEIQLQLDEIQASRTRIVEAADEERRRIERDIHDGAQQRLVSLSMALRMLNEEVGERIDGSLGELIARADEEARAAIDEVRDLARGVHPKVLTDAGLDEALLSLAETAPLPVLVLSELRQRYAPAVEAAAYFVCSEALANCAKHAGATTAVVRAEHTDGRLQVSVEDDGRGGASMDRGKGLRGLADRVAALGGDLHVDSPPRAGTRISAWIPTTEVIPDSRGLTPLSGQEAEPRMSG